MKNDKKLFVVDTDDIESNIEKLYVVAPVQKPILIMGIWINNATARHFFKITYRMLWLLIKYKFIWGMDISMTVTKAIDREIYFVQIFAE